MEISAALVKKLRDTTGAGFMECKAALTEANGDIDAATTLLRKRGLASAAKKAGRTTSQGSIGSYIHMGGKIGVLVEVNCESDFVARTDQFVALVKEIAMHIAAADPKFVRREEVPGDILDKDGFFDTGDIATIDPVGYMQITDRAKDVVKSGGEWISTIDIENIALGHPAAEQTAVIGVPHPKWDERPILIVKLRDGQTATRQEFLDFLQGKIAKWWMPDDVVFVPELPHTATGKLSKLTLRQQFKDYRLDQK